MSLAIPYSFIGGVGNKARASEVNANFQAVAAKFTEGVGGIADGDISSIAAIKGTKLSNVAGNRVPTDRIEDNAVDATKLRSDATAGSPSAGVGSASNIKDGIITNIKLAPGTIAKDRLKLTEVTQVFSGLTMLPGAGASGIGANTVLPSPALPAMSAMLPISVTLESVTVSAGSLAAVGISLHVGNAGVVFYDVWAALTTGGPFTFSGTIRYRYLAVT